MGYQESIPAATGWATGRFGVLAGTMLQISNESAKEGGMMDTSKQYIKMRLAAAPDLGDGIPMGFSINWRSGTVLVDEKGDWYYSTKDECVQLEGQDQLQRMMGLSLPELLGSWFRWLLLGLSQECFDTLEKLWLAFVMKEVYNKVWNGENWE